MNRIVLAAIAVAVLCSAASAQGIADKKADQPCTGKLDTVASCWGCFQSLLADCEKVNQEEAARKACYQGANTFFSWCLGRVGDPKLPTNDQFNQDWVRGAALERSFIFPEGSNRVSVWIRIPGEREYQRDPVIEAQFDGSFLLIVEWPEINLADESFVGVVLVFRDDDRITEAVADTVGLID